MRALLGCLGLFVACAAHGAATQVVQDINAGSNGSACSSGMIAMDGFALFGADDGTHGCEVWRTDGTAAGTTRLAGMPAGTTFVRAGAYAYTAVSVNNGPAAMYRTDGTIAGSGLVMQRTSTRAPAFAAVGSTLFFADGSDLWRVDGTSAPVKVMDASAGIIDILSVHPAAHSVYVTTSGATAAHLWHVDATTSVVTDTGPIDLSLQNVSALDDVLVYRTEMTGDIWRSDGTPAGTYRLWSATTSRPHVMGTLGSFVYFASDESSGGTIYRTDGTVGGTTAIATLTKMDSFAFSASELWIAGTSATISGLYRIRAVDNALSLVAPYDGSMPVLALSGSTAVFLHTISDPVASSFYTDIGVSDGTLGGTVTLERIANGLYSFAGGVPAAMLPSGFLFRWTDATVGSEPRFMAFDSTPDPVSFQDAMNAAANASVVSQPWQITGITVDTPVSATNGQFCISSGNNCNCDVQPFATVGIVRANQYICVRNTAGATPASETITQLAIGGTSATFRSVVPGFWLTRDATPGGNSIVAVGSGIPTGHEICYGVCTDPFVPGTALRLVAAHAPGYAFTGWSGDCSGTGDCNVVMNAGVNVTANFVAAPFVRASRDLNGDGRSDILLNGPGGVHIMEMFGPTVLEGGGVSMQSTDVLKLDGDFNGDGQADLLLRGIDGTYRLALMTGTVPMSFLDILPGGTGWEVVAKGDFNGDGKTDLLWKSPDGVYGMWLMDGTNVLGAGLFQSPGIGWEVQVIADFDGDGKSDILWRNSDGRIQEWAMDGANSTAQVTMTSYQNEWMPLFAGDFDGDGKADLVWSHPDGSIAVWMVDGTTVRSATVLVAGNSGWHVKLVGDLDGDGKSDIVLEDANGALGAWLMNGNSIAAAAQILAPFSAWSLVTSGDYNGDGRTDLVLRNNVNGYYGMWLMDGLAPMLAVALTSGVGLQIAP